MNLSFTCNLEELPSVGLVIVMPQAGDSSGKSQPASIQHQLCLFVEIDKNKIGHRLPGHGD